MSAENDRGGLPDANRLLQQLAALLSGSPASVAPLANALSVQAFGFETFGRTDAVDLFAGQPLMLSATPHVLAAPGAMVVMDVTVDGRTIGVFADVMEGVLTRVWVAGPVAAGAVAEPAVGVASDDFLTQDRTPCAGDALDHPQLGGVARELRRQRLA